MDIRAGSAEETRISQRHDQGCVECSRGLEDSKLPLSTPTSVQLAPTSPECVESVFYELRHNGVLRSPHGPTSGEMGLRWSCQGYSGSLLAPEVYGTARRATPLFHLATCGIIRAHELLHGTR